MIYHFKKGFLGSIAISIIFYIISNFFVFVGTDMYDKSILGLLKCYYMGVPFFINRLTYLSFFGCTLLSVCADKNLMLIIIKKIKNQFKI